MLKWFNLYMRGNILIFIFYVFFLNVYVYIKFFLIKMLLVNLSNCCVQQFEIYQWVNSGFYYGVDFDGVQSLSLGVVFYVLFKLRKYKILGVYQRLLFWFKVIFFGIVFVGEELV